MPRAARARWDRVPLARFVQGGVIPTTTDALPSELLRTWARPEAAELGVFYALVAPDYAAVAESYVRAQQAAQPSNRSRDRRRSPGERD